MRIVWDEPKRERNLEEHGFDFIDARERFDFATALIEPIYPSRTGRVRYQAIGLLDGEKVILVFSPLGSEALSLVSLRHASRKERKRYDKA